MSRFTPHAYPQGNLLSLQMIFVRLSAVHNIERTVNDIGMLSLGFADHKEDPDSNIKADERKELLASLKLLDGYSDSMNMEDLNYLVKEVFIPIVQSDENISYDDVAQQRQRISDSLDGVLKKYKCLLLSREEGDIYENWEKEWEKVVLKWGVLSYDIKNSGKCLAVGRSTAAVFHLMRILEKGGQLLLDHLKVVPKNNKAIEDLQMNEMVGLLNEKVEEISNPQNGQKKDKEFASQLSLARIYLLDAKEAWRNPVMHPKSTWEPEEAKDIYKSTKKFMNQLVLILPEQSS